MRFGMMFAIFVLVVPPGQAQADQTDPRLGALFETLAQTADADDATGLVQRIMRIWRDPGSPSIDLLMTRALKAADGEDYVLALKHLDDVVDLAPDYADGWFNRGSVYYLTDRYDLAVPDFERALALEPRHFIAWEGLGQIYLETGRQAQALTAFRRARALDPSLKGVGKKIQRLEKQVEGQGI